jgi:peptidoglycan/LPS O-acetylase OafA/YrhL
MIFVDGLRGLASLAIVLPHTADIFHTTTMKGGWLGIWLFNIRFYAIPSVQVFFVLSGFVIAYTLREIHLKPAVLGRFLLRRSIRLDPPYWLSLLLSASVWVLVAPPGHHRAAVPSLPLMLAHLFYLQDLLGYGEPINHIFWTLCVEIQMYLVFSAAICLLQAMRVPYRPVLTIGLIVSLAWPMGFFASPLRRCFIVHEYCFLAGAVSWWTLEKAIPRWMTLAAAGLFLAASVSRNGDYHIWVTFITAILLVAAGKSGGLYTWLGSKPLQYFGGISYGLYLVHDPVIQLILPLQRHWQFTSTADAFVTLAIAYLTAIAAAHAMRKFVEVPSIRLSHRLKLEPSIRSH